MKIKKAAKAYEYDPSLKPYLKEGTNALKINSDKLTSSLGYKKTDKPVEIGDVIEMAQDLHCVLGSAYSVRRVESHNKNQKVKIPVYRKSKRGKQE